MLDLSHAPAPILRLVVWLQGRGFQQIDERQSDPANLYVLFANDSRQVKITASRGDWSLGIGIAGRTFHPEQWEAWLKGQRLPEVLGNLDQQVDFITTSWDFALEVARLRPQTEDEIERIGDDWVERRLGFRPPASPDPG